MRVIINEVLTYSEKKIMNESKVSENIPVLVIFQWLHFAPSLAHRTRPASKRITCFCFYLPFLPQVSSLTCPIQWVAFHPPSPPPFCETVPPLPTACSQLINLTHFIFPFRPTLTKDMDASRKIKYHSIMLGYFRLNMYQESILPSGFPFFFSSFFFFSRTEGRRIKTTIHLLADSNRKWTDDVYLYVSVVSVWIWNKGIC